MVALWDPIRKRIQKNSSRLSPADSSNAKHS